MQLLNKQSCFNHTWLELKLTQVILEKTIIKLGSLLALGFGEACRTVSS